MTRTGMSNSHRNRARRFGSFRYLTGLFLVAGLVMTGCGSDGENETADEQAAPAPAGDVLRLQVGTNDSVDAPTASVLIEFADQVESLSTGLIEVEPVWNAAGDPPPDDWDQAVAAKVISGDLDLGLIPTAAWDTQEVTSLRALNAPFLVDSDELVAAIVSGEVAEELMAGLDKAGVTGLALVPEGLRYAFGYGRALASPADFEGVAIRAPRSDTVYSLFETLGATVDDPQGSEFDEQASDGTLAGVESSFARASRLPGNATFAVGNLVLFPKVNALVVNADTLASLTETQRAVLEDAAARTLDVVLEGAQGDAVMAEEYCAAGGTVVAVDDSVLADFIAAVTPVYAELETDPTTRALIEDIRVLKLEVPPRSPIAPCEADENDPQPQPVDGPSIPAGTYERTITTADGIDLDSTIVAELLGPDGEKEIELVIEPDSWTLYELSDDGEWSVGDLGSYSYDADGHWVTVSESGGCSGCIGGFDWSLDGDQLTLALVEVDGHSSYDDAVRLMTEGDYRSR